MAHVIIRNMKQGSQCSSNHLSDLSAQSPDIVKLNKKEQRRQKCLIFI